MRRFLSRREPEAGLAADASPTSAAPLEHAHLDGRRSIELDYPFTPQVRWGGDRPSHPQLHAILDRRRAAYREVIAAVVEQHERFRAIPVEETSADEPCWVNGWLPGLDSAVLYTMLATTDPATYLEVGSGNSTSFARRAIRDHDLRTRIVSIDPEPRAAIDALCDEVVRERAETVDLEVYDQLAAGDILFIDNSHRCLQNSDATVMFLDVLPRLASGVLVEIHDITLPDDYPEEWLDRAYSEQYLLAAYLLAEGSRFDVVLPNHFVSHDAELQAPLDAMWDDPHFAGVERHGGSFWLRIR
ncbi:MAG: class I SAM-dependent methyltransferase [Actinobacteria bacterium]|nr:class I SAM-dependent methyltransferase [Actinomycetota bacterium]